MKKALCIIFSLLVMITVTGCSPKQEKAEETPAVEENIAEEPTVEETVKFSRGSWDGDKKVFTNETTGILISLSGTYDVTSDDELAEAYLGDSTVDLSSWTDADYEREINVPETQFYNPFTNSNCVIVYENLLAENALSITEDGYLDIFLKNINDIYENIESSGPYDLSLSGCNYRTLDISYTTQDIPIAQKVAVRKTGNYMAVVVFTDAYDPADMETMISFFN